MVKKGLLIFVALILTTSIFFMPVINAQTREYYFQHEWVKIWINQDGTIDLLYDLSLTLVSGGNINYVLIGQPTGDFTIGGASDQYGRNLATSDASEGRDYKVKINLFEPLTAGETINFSLTTNVARMIWEDPMNPGNVGMQFTPTWFQANIQDLRIALVMPPKVTQEMVKTTEVYWDNILTEGDRLVVYWEEQNLFPDQKFPIGVSFPKEYVQNYQQQSTGWVEFLQIYGLILIIGPLSLVLVFLIIRAGRKKSYSSPKVGIETLGIKRGLTAVEASYLLELKAAKIVTAILYGLLQKRVVWVESTNPSIKLKIMPTYQNKTGTIENPLRYYEIDFLNAIKDKDSGSLDEEKLAHTIMFLRDTVEQKLRGFNRNETKQYYDKIVAKAWTQVEQAGTAELASKTYDEQLLWLMLDPKYGLKTETAFRDRSFEPNPLWFWYWYGHTHYDPHRTSEPNIKPPSQTTKPPAIPGAEFANNIATAVEKTSSNIVVNIEKFANAILPASTPKASHNPARHGTGCVCACAACACACACVSCACACAGGGVG